FRMPRCAYSRFLAIAALALAGATCGSKSPTAPGSTGSGASCRTYASTLNVQTTNSASSITFNATQDGSFDTGSKKSTATVKVAGGAACSVAVTSYNSVADFVDEVGVIPTIAKSTSTTTTNQGGCGTSTGTSTNSYDSQGRLKSTSNNLGATTTYTA